VRRTRIVIILYVYSAGEACLAPTKPCGGKAKHETDKYVENRTIQLSANGIALLKTQKTPASLEAGVQFSSKTTY